MNIEALLTDLFPAGHSVSCERHLLFGFGNTNKGQMAVFGTAQQLAIGSEAAMDIADFVLKVVKDRPGCPILMLVDTQGQRLSKQEEILGINGFLAHLVKCLEMARRKGHRLITLVYGEAVSGGFLSFGLMADEIHALDTARIRVMNLPAMARITKLPLAMLKELSVDSPWFAPGVENFHKLGGIHSVWSQPLYEHLEKALDRQTFGDHRRQEGLARQGRRLALPVSQTVSTSKQATA